MKSFQKILFKIFTAIAPAITANKIYQYMSNPRVRKLRDFEERVLDRSDKEHFSFEGFKIQTYTWGNASSPLAFLVHGWEGQAGNFGAVVELLLELGYQVKAFDAPSHGHSSKGITNMSQFSHLVSHLLKEYRPNLIISHSFGTVTSLMALSRNAHIPIDKWIIVTTPHDYKDYIGEIQKFIGINDRTMQRVVRKVELDFGASLDTMNMEFFSNKVSHVKDALIVHSKKDKILPIESARIANQYLRQSRLKELDNHGHYSILWSDELKEIIRTELN